MRDQAPADIPETDDPVILRELLRQAREQLRLRDSIEQVMADNVARAEAVMLAGTAPHAPSMDLESIQSELASLRASLGHALAATERLDALTRDAAPATNPQPAATHLTPPADATPMTIEVVIHEVRSPALARSLQQYLAGLAGVSRAEVRELAEGLLRITVESTTPLSGDALAGWEPQRGRAIRTASPDVLEIELHADTQ